MNRLNPLFEDPDRKLPYVNEQLIGEINNRLASVQSHLSSANALLSLLLDAYSRVNSETFRALSPQMNGLALAIVDQVHLAGNVAKSLRRISACAREFPSGKYISEPQSLESLNPDLARALNTACEALKEAFKEVKGIRDTAHHADERLNGTARTGRTPKKIATDGPICIGVFTGGEVLFIHSTAVLRGSDEETNDSIPGYLATFELSKKSLDAHTEMIWKIFACLPYAEPFQG